MARAGGLPLPTITDDRVLGESVIQKSLRFRSGASAYLTRTPSSAGNRKTWTWSAWIKRGTLGSRQILFSADDNATHATYFILELQSDDNLRCLAGQETASATCVKETAAVIRDTTNWYHLVFKFDAANTSAVWYINGQEITNLNSSTNPSNQDFQVNATTQHFLGRFGSSLGTSYFDGYMAEVNFVDGYAYDASYFGFTDSQTGVWMPKRYEEAYGTNGFRLDFLDNSSAAALGIDKSPNGNDYTVNNHSASANLTNDSMPDTPTNNFCTLNHLNKTTSFSGKDGGLTFDQTSNDQAITGTFFVTSGKWYWEFYKNSGHNPEIGISVVGEETLNNRSTGFIDGRAAFISNDGRIRTGSSSTADITGSSSGQTGAGWLRIACDMDNKKIWFSDLSGNYFNSGNPATGANPAYDFSSHATANGWAPYICLTTANDANGYPNFGQFDLNSFSSNIPAGFKTLTAKNLRDELLTNPSIVNPKKHFNTLIYTGNGAASGHRITGLQFQPDFVWIKNRGQTYDHHLYDSVRGVGKYLESNDTTAEATGTHMDGFLTNGFSVGNGSSSNRTNYNGNTYVGWCWKAGGSSSTYNVDGKGYATQAASGIHAGTLALTGASVNTAAGFSIVTWTGDGNSSANVGTGLDSDKTLDWVIVKKTNTTGEWQVGHSGSGYGVNFAYHMELNSGAALSGSAPYYMGTQSQTNGDRLYLAGNGADNGDNYIAYIWQERPGYSKFGTYDGNLNVDGPFIHLGFRPAWVMIARLSGDNWIIKDSTRNTFNDVYSNLTSNSNAAEFGSSGNNQTFDFVSNGFKIRGQDSGVSSNGNPFIYMAFAEQPGVSPFTTTVNAR